jgi:GNAT superfamily N-acetyltransferase
MKRFGAKPHEIEIVRRLPAEEFLRMEQLRARFLESQRGRRAASVLEDGAPIEAEDGLLLLTPSAQRHDGTLDRAAALQYLKEHEDEIEAAQALFDAGRLERGEVPTDDFGAGPGGETLLAVRESRVVGFLVTGDANHDYVAEAMDAMFVVRHWRRRGIGRELILDLLRRNPSARPAIDTEISVDARVLFESVAPHLLGREPGRNDPCWCGSGKKFKRCHG